MADQCLAGEQHQKHVVLRSGYVAALTNDRTEFQKSVRIHPDAYTSRDYHEHLFSTSQRISADCPQLASHEVGKSAATDCHILCVHPEGEYIRIFNKSSYEQDLARHMIIQLLACGHVVLTYCLPERLTMPAFGVVTLWRECSTSRRIEVPMDYVCHGVAGWVRGNCTTTLCRPDGQAIAWTTTTRRPLPDDQCFTGVCASNQDTSMCCGLPGVEDPGSFWSDELRNRIEMRLPNNVDQRTMFPCRHRTTCCGNITNCCCPMMACLRRERPIPEVLCAGAPAQRMGCSSLRKLFVCNP